MSAEKIGSLTNNRCGGWRNRMQTGKYLTKPSHPLLSWDAQGWGGERLVHLLRAWKWVQCAWEVGRWPEQAEPGEAWRRARRLAPEALPQCDVLFCPRHMHRLSEVKTGVLLGIEQEAC